MNAKNCYFARFFNPAKNPGMEFGLSNLNPPKMPQILVWDSYNKGTYIFKEHGELECPRKSKLRTYKEFKK